MVAVHHKRLRFDPEELPHPRILASALLHEMEPLELFLLDSRRPAKAPLNPPAKATQLRMTLAQVRHQDPMVVESLKGFASQKPVTSGAIVCLLVALFLGISVKVLSVLFRKRYLSKRLPSSSSADASNISPSHEYSCLIEEGTAGGSGDEREKLIPATASPCYSKFRPASFFR